MSDLAGLGRFSEPALLVLVSLAEGSKHGYAMVEDIERLQGTRLGPGTLYGAISRLEARGLIEPLEAQDRRRPYQLTPAGREVLRRQLAAMELVVATGRRRLRTA